MKNKENLINMKITKMQHKLLIKTANSFIVSKYKRRYDFMDDIIEEQTYDSQTDNQIFEEQEEEQVEE